MLPQWFKDWAVRQFEDLARDKILGPRFLEALKSNPDGLVDILRDHLRQMAAKAASDSGSGHDASALGDGEADIREIVGYLREHFLQQSQPAV